METFVPTDIFARDEAAPNAQPPALSLYRLLEPEILANPYPLYEQLRREGGRAWIRS